MDPNRAHPGGEQGQKTAFVAIDAFTHEIPLQCVKSGDGSVAAERDIKL
jgi:hypothetical protein